MLIGILSRGAHLYSTQRLVRAAMLRGHQVRLVDYSACQLVMRRGLLQVIYNQAPLPTFDAIIPRIGASYTQVGCALVEQFEGMGTFTSAKASAIRQARDKLRCLQKLSRWGVDTPKTATINDLEGAEQLIAMVDGPPVIIKLIEGTHGIGVFLADTNRQAISMIEAFQKMKAPVLLQEFIEESNGADIRAFVVGGKVVASMKRQAPEDEFRSNLHRGATAEPIELSKAEHDVALKVVKLMGLDVAGVDILQSKRGPLVMEVNASPGLEGIEGTTGVDIAGKIIQHIEERVDQLQVLQKNMKR